jgi:hypothetical protein
MKGWAFRGKSEHAILAGTLALALLLRLWGIGFGLPFIYHYDERFYVHTALNLGAGVLANPPHAPTGLSNILFVQYAGYYLLGHALGTFASPQAFERAYRTDPTIFHGLARLTVVLLGTFGVWAVYVMGRESDDRATGLLAAGFLAVSFLHVRDSHYGVPDVAMATSVTLAVGLALIGLRSRKWRHTYFSALAAGFAIALKWTAFPVVLPVFWAGLVGEGQRGKGLLRRLTARQVLYLGALVALGFSLGSPQILLKPKPYVQEALGQYGAGDEGGFEIWQVDTISGWAYYVKTLIYGVGAVMLVLALVGIVSKIVLSRNDGTVLLLAFPLGYYLLMGATRHYFARYALPLVPFVALFAAEGTVRVSSWLSRRRSVRLMMITMLGVLVAAQPLAQSVRSDLLLVREDTRTSAKKWIEANIPDGARIAVDWRFHTPPLATPEIYSPRSERTYEVYEVKGEGLSAHSAAWYRDQGYDYLITSSFIYRISLVDPEQNARRRVFYNSLGSEFVLVKTFSPSESSTEMPFIFDEIYGAAVSLWQRDRPGPTIEIYAVR